MFAIKEETISIILECFKGISSTLFQMIIIIIPLMIILEVGKYYNIVDYIARKIYPFFSKIGLSKKASFPLSIGIVFGITYGSGVMFDYFNEGEITKEDVSIIILFLIICHALIEDTLLFWTVGGNFWLLSFGRIFLALLVVYLYNKIILKKGIVWRWENGRNIFR